MEKLRYDADAPKNIKKLTLPDGSRVGIVNLDNILQEVADLKLVNDKAIKAELLKKAMVHNYIPSSAETDYSIALFEEYRIKSGQVKPIKDRSHVHKPGG